MPTKIILIRHGQTLWSRKKRYCGSSDISLSARGRNQARKLYQVLKKEKISKVYSSNAARAWDFAKIAFKGMKIKTITQLREFNFGIFEGLNYEEIKQKYPQIYGCWLKNPLAVDLPNGENINNFKKRVEKIFAKIARVNKNKTIAIVTHAGPIKVILGDILKKKEFWELNVDLASMHIING